MAETTSKEADFWYAEFQQAAQERARAQRETALWCAACLGLTLIFAAIIFCLEATR